ncbi:hypothetical protein [Cupriavidus pauculus]|uniref:hypothetical protein n=1 Tax=Cupriavidus pauculus TaxID=82633 RepID=UPI0011AF7EA9|nr:hypothetical protein [Cupriavidus pauculus]
MNRTLSIANAILCVIGGWLIFSFARQTHSVPTTHLLLFIPSGAAWLALKKQSRTFGGIAAAANAILGLTGILVVLVSVLGGGNPQGTFEPVLALAGIFVLAVAILNFRAAWGAFPPVQKQPNESGK